MSGKNRSKFKVHISKPEPPPFLQRIKEQIIANEDSERKERSLRKRKTRSGRPEDPEDNPIVVKIGDDDLTEEEYKNMKREFETQYKLDGDRGRIPSEELDVDVLIKNRNNQDLSTTSKSNKPSTKSPTGGKLQNSDEPRSGSFRAESTSKPSKILSYGSSSEDGEG